MTYQRQILLSTDPVPRTSIKLLSLLGHVVALALIVAIRHAAGPQMVIVPAQYVTVQTIPRSDHVVFSPSRAKPALPRATLLRIPKSARMKRPSEPILGGDSTSLETLRGRAGQATARLMADFKFSQIYGFSPEDYRFPVLTSGVLPTILASELPSRFEQYLTVEVTIDIDGHVADARLVSGEAMPKIEQRVLAAIREFKYIPAKRGGSPIPSQVDIVVHIPS